VLAAAKADLEPGLARRMGEERRGIDRRVAIGQRHAQRGQHRVEQRRAPGAQLAPAPAAEAVDEALALVHPGPPQSRGGRARAARPPAFP